MPSTVPPELISIIIDSLHSDKHALVQCSRVSTAFYGATQIQLYVSINLSSGYAGPLNSVPHIRCRRLLRTLSGSRHLASYIKELHVLNGAWTLAEPSFPRLLVLIAARGALKVFRYGYRYPFVIHTSWREFDFLLQRALNAIFECPSLHSLSLEGILLSTFPNCLLATVSQLRHLAMRAPVSWSMTNNNNIHSEMSFLQVPFNSSPENLQLSFLESLALYGDGANILGYLTKPRCPLKLSRLRKLEIGKILWDTATLIPWLFDQVAQTLEDLHWVKPRTDSPIYGLNRLLSVRSVTFTVMHTEVEAFIVFLDDWGFPPNVELITIFLVLVPRHFSWAQDRQYPWIGRLDAILYHNAPGATVDMQVFCYEDTDSDFDHGEIMIPTLFPSMSGSSRFQLSIRDMAHLKEAAQASRLLYNEDYHGETLTYA